MLLAVLPAPPRPIPSVALAALRFFPPTLVPITAPLPLPRAYAAARPAGGRGDSGDRDRGDRGDREVVVVYDSVTAQDNCTHLTKRLKVLLPDRPQRRRPCHC